MIAAEVFLWGTRIGVVMQEDTDSIAKFNYDEKFLKSQIEVSPIVMPLSKQVYSFPALSLETFKGLPGLLCDSLPDKFGTKLVERYLAEQGRNLQDFSSVERLCYVGNRGMGALEYVPAKKYFDTPDQSIHLDALVQLASDILSEKESVHIQRNTHAMEQIIKVGTSAGGAREKAVIAWNEQTNDIRSGQVDAGKGYGYWLIKFDGIKNNKDKGEVEDGPEYTRIEYAYYMMAKVAGIEMSECRLYEENGNYHFMTKRFDRNPENGSKLHMQSLGAMAHYDFNEPGAYSYEQVADVIYRLGMGQKEIEQLYRRMVFNIMARNQDDHVKNISFLMDRKGGWSLSPAYDITYAYDKNNRWLAKHQMSVNGKTDNYTKLDLEECASRMIIGKRRMGNILEEDETAIATWQVFAEKAEIGECTYNAIKDNFLVVR